MGPCGQRWTLRARPAAAAAWTATTEPPERVHIRVPYGTTYQKNCSGEYQIVKDGARPNGLPIWEHTSVERVLYNGSDGLWYVTDDPGDFDDSIGYIRHPANQRGLPQIPGHGWERYIYSFED